MKRLEEATAAGVTGASGTALTSQSRNVHVRPVTLHGMKGDTDSGTAAAAAVVTPNAVAANNPWSAILLAAGGDSVVRENAEADMALLTNNSLQSNNSRNAYLQVEIGSRRHWRPTCLGYICVDSNSANTAATGLPMQTLTMSPAPMAAEVRSSSPASSRRRAVEELRQLHISSSMLGRDVSPSVTMVSEGNASSCHLATANGMCEGEDLGASWPAATIAVTDSSRGGSDGLEDVHPYGRTFRPRKSMYDSEEGSSDELSWRMKGDKKLASLPYGTVGGAPRAVQWTPPELSCRRVGSRMAGGFLLPGIAHGLKAAARRLTCFGGVDGGEMCGREEDEGEV